MSIEPANNPQHKASLGSRSNLSVVLVLSLLLALVLYDVLVLVPTQAADRLLLAPMIGQLEACMYKSTLPPEHAIDPAFVACTSEAGSAASVIESTLSLLGPRISTNGRYELGYTLNVPLLKFLVWRAGGWELDREAISRFVKTIAQSDRRLVLYLFSTHFSASAPIESALASDPANLAYTPQGPLGKDKHYGMDVFPWSIARTDNSLTQSRVRVIQAFVQALCDQPQAVRDRVAAITLLGEVHHMFPKFESGMGFDGPYLVSDYSQQSLADFRLFLKDRFHTVASLNAALGGASFTSFATILPPAKDIRTDRLKNFWEHIDSYASGSFPVQGWLAPNPRLTGWVQIYLNGAPIARTLAGLGRQDVLDHLPEVGTADVGWRQEIDFRSLAPGIYQVAAMAETRQGLPILLDKRNVAIMDRAQSTPVQMSVSALPEHLEIQEILADMDSPKNQSSYYFNPLATLWMEFRALQVVKYQQFVEQPLIHSCLASVPRYIHQLFPYPNPSWDWGKYAVDASLRGAGDLNLGISLYGEATYGESFMGWKRHNVAGGYGITEFHPLRAMDRTELTQVFDRHHENGARFLSFFLEGRGPINQPYATTGPTIPFFGEANTQNGSNQLYRSLQQLLIQP
jgi:hypothetical protein